jgi:hypothetical protein
MAVDIAAILGTMATNMEAGAGPAIEQVGAWAAMVAEATAVVLAVIIDLGKLADAPSSLQPRYPQPTRAWPKDR